MTFYEGDHVRFYDGINGPRLSNCSINGTVPKGTTGGNLKNADGELVFYATSEIGNIPLKDGCVIRKPAATE